LDKKGITGERQTVPPPKKKGGYVLNEKAVNNVHVYEKQNILSIPSRAGYRAQRKKTTSKGAGAT
jgi:hypothetical protein